MEGKHQSYRCAGAHHVFLQFRHHFGKDQLMVGLETVQLGESRDEKT